MDIVFHGTLDEETYTRAVRAQKTLRRMLIGLGAIALISIFGVVVVPLQQGAAFSPYMLAPLIWIAAMVWLWRATVSAARKQLAENKLLQGPIRGVAREDRIEITTDYTSAALPWETLHHYELVPDAVLLFTSPGVAHILPRSFFGSGEDWDLFVSRLAEKVIKTPRPKGNSIVRTLIIWIAIIVVIFLLRAFQHTSG